MLPIIPANSATASGNPYGIFAYGGTGSGSRFSMSNLVSDTGVVGTDVTGVGEDRGQLGACEYGDDKGIFAYGYDNIQAYVSMSNLVSNTGVVASDVTGVGTGRRGLGGAAYGGDKGIFAYGDNDVVGPAYSWNGSNLVSNTGVIGTDVTGVGTGRSEVVACEYGGDKAIFGLGFAAGSPNAVVGMTNLVSNAGVVASDVSAVGTARRSAAACGYGYTKGIFGYGSPYTAVTNLVSNTGVVGTDVTGVGTARSGAGATQYGDDKGIFAYGTADWVTFLSMSNLVSNTGVVGTDVTGVGTVRQGVGACSYG